MKFGLRYASYLDPLAVASHAHLTYDALRR
jgi:hypothetical protein